MKLYVLFTQTYFVPCLHNFFHHTLGQELESQTQAQSRLPLWVLELR